MPSLGHISSDCGPFGRFAEPWLGFCRAELRLRQASWGGGAVAEVASGVGGSSLGPDGRARLASDFHPRGAYELTFGSAPAAVERSPEFPQCRPCPKSGLSASAAVSHASAVNDLAPYNQHLTSDLASRSVSNKASLGIAVLAAASSAFCLLTSELFELTRSCCATRPRASPAPGYLACVGSWSDWSAGEPAQDNSSLLDTDSLSGYNVQCHTRQCTRKFHFGCARLTEKGRHDPAERTSV